MKIWIVFYADSGAREDCSVYYCWLVRANDKTTAISRVVSLFGQDPANLDAEERDVL